MPASSSSSSLLFQMPVGHFLGADQEATTAMNDDFVLPSLPSQLYVFGNNQVLQLPSSDFYSSPHNKLSRDFSVTGPNFLMEDDDDFVVPHHFLDANCQSGSSSSATNRLDALPSDCQTYIPSFKLPHQPLFPAKKLKTPEFEPVRSNADRPPIEAHGRLLMGEEHHIQTANNKKRKTWTAEKPCQHIRTATESLVDRKNYKMQAPVIKRSQKLNDRITALQKLVSPYGKTDTASVLQEAVIYIKLLQERIKNAVEVHRSSNPIIMARPIGLPRIAVEQSLSMGQRSKEVNLRGRGLCLVPISMIQNFTNDENAPASASASASRIDKAAITY